MIRLERGKIDYSGRILSKSEKVIASLEGFFRVPLSERIQRAPRFDSGIWSSLRPQLFKLFHGKCAYCETPIVGDMGEIDQFRPKVGAINLDKKKAPDHYWWLAYDLENLYLSCRNCNFSKGSKFPVRNERGRIGTPLKELRLLEDALLIDPFEDDPDSHLAFGENGQVSPITEKGKVTIEVLNLNRPNLVEARATAVQTTLDTLSMVIAAGKNVEAWIKKELLLNAAYSAAKKQCLYRFLKEQITPTHGQSGGSPEETVIKELEESTPYISSEQQTIYDQEFQARQVASEISPTESPAGIESLYIKTQHISKVVIRNFRVIEDLTLLFPSDTSDVTPKTTPWMILLGENGMGKSSILKAIALTLMPEAKRDSLGINPRRLVRHGADEGFVEVYLTGYTTPFRLDFDRSSNKFRSDPNVFHSPLFCYGGTRLLPTKKHPGRSSSDDFSRVSNLFDPFIPLIDATNWLLGLDEERFGFSARAIKNLLSADDEKELVRIPRIKPTDVVLRSSARGQIQDGASDIVDSQSVSDDLESLSDGYQSMIALVMDVLEIMLKHYDDVSDSEGLVLIDEIDVHLHPRWKIEILSLLRKVFPRVQFVITTHDPLCLIGSLPGEVHVLRRDLITTRIDVLQHDIPPGTSAEQVLTGFWFGLRSTLDADTLTLLDRHRALLRETAVGSDPPARMINEMQQLENELRGRLGTYADTSLDKMAQAVASEVIDRKIGEVDFSKREEIRERIKTKLEALVSEKG